MLNTSEYLKQLKEIEGEPTEIFALLVRFCENLIEVGYPATEDAGEVLARIERAYLKEIE